MRNAGDDRQRVSIHELAKGCCHTPQDFLKYVNCLIEDPEAIVSFKNKKTVEEERIWLSQTIGLIKSGSMVMLVACCAGNIIGAAAISLLRERREHVGELGISIIKGYRDSGLGSRMLRSIITLAGEKLKPHPSMIRVNTFSVNERGVAFYLRNGFKQVATIPAQFQNGDKLVDEAVLLYTENT